MYPVAVFVSVCYNTIQKQFHFLEFIKEEIQWQSI